LPQEGKYSLFTLGWCRGRCIDPFKTPRWQINVGKLLAEFGAENCRLSTLQTYLQSSSRKVSWLRSGTQAGNTTGLSNVLTVSRKWCSILLDILNKINDSI
jgi:hypothetical protein